MVTQQVSLYWNEAIVNVSIREKTLQERQQALFLEFHGRGITRLLVVFICWHQRKKRKLLIDHRLEVYALHVIIQMH